MHEGPLDIQDHYSFRFVDKWRISHNWLSGPVELQPCSYLLNAFDPLNSIRSDLNMDRNTPFIEKENTIYVVGDHKGMWFLSEPREKIYGTNRDGKFIGYSAFCGHLFRDSLDGLALHIVRPDSAKGSDEWIKDARAIDINGLHWLHKEIPIQNWSESRERANAPIEILVLKIPDTQYWMVLRFASSIGGNLGMGTRAHPEKHRKLLDLFHQIIKSVKLEPITPIDIDQLLKDRQEAIRK